MTEYVDDVPYVRHFLEELAPPRLRLVAALNGLEPPPADDFDYCELGCAHGDTLVALAAAHPNARFLGVDLADDHIASAKRLARDGGLENVGLLARDFGDLLTSDATDDVGELDFVVAHGVMTWISPAKRKELVAFAAKKLKPGGLLYVSYNAMPGWASVEPLRQLLLFPGGEGSSADRAARGLAFAQAMQKAGAEYFARNPAANDMLATMTKAGLPYVVHEYLHEHWTPMYFARVAWEMADADLHFAGSLPLHLDFRDTALPEPVATMFANVDDRITFESLKDFAINEFFRRDVYVKGKRARAIDTTNAFLDAATWSTTATTPPATDTVALPHRTLRIDGVPARVFDALLEAPGGIRELAARTGATDDEVRKAIVRLCIVDRAIPVTSPRPRPARDGRYAIVGTYNQTMIRRLAGDAPLVLASTVAGTAFPISALEALAVRVVTEAEAADRASWIEAFVDRSVLRIRVGDRAIETRDDQKKAIRTAVDDLVAKKVAKMVELGILA